MLTVSNRYHIRPQWSPWQILYPVTYPQSVPAVLGPQVVQLVTQRAGEALNNKEKFLLPLIQCEAACKAKTLSTLWQDVTKHAITTCRCNSNTKQTRDFPKDKGNCYRDSVRKHIKLLKITKNIW